MMMKNLTRCATGLSVLVLCTAVGCDNTDPAAAPPTAPPAGQTGAAPNQPEPTGAVAEASGHDPHEAIVLGPMEAEAYAVTVRVHGEIAAGQTAHLDILVEGTPPAAAVRVWVGDEQAVGIRKGRGETTGPGQFHAHTSVPAPLPEDAKLWVEVEHEDGALTLASFDIEPAMHNDDEHSHND